MSSWQIDIKDAGTQRHIVETLNIACTAGAACLPSKAYRSPQVNQPASLTLELLIPHHPPPQPA
jgi:hypothetical protein